MRTRNSISKREEGSATKEGITIIAASPSPILAMMMRRRNIRTKEYGDGDCDTVVNIFQSLSFWTCMARMYLESSTSVVFSLKGCSSSSQYSSLRKGEKRWSE